MNPLYDFTTRDGIAHTIDLRRIVAIGKSAEADCSTFHMDPADDDLCLDDDVADPLTEAWRALHGAAIYRILPLPSVEHKFIDLRRISRTATARTGIVTAYTDPSDHSFSVHPSAGGPLLSAWRAHNTPRPDEAGPGLPHPWRFATVPNGRTYASSSMTAGWCGIDEDGTLSASGAPPEVIDAVRAAHRARVGGAP